MKPKVHCCVLKLLLVCTSPKAGEFNTLAGSFCKFQFIIALLPKHEFSMWSFPFLFSTDKHVNVNVIVNEWKRDLRSSQKCSGLRGSYPVKLGNSSRRHTVIYQIWLPTEIKLFGMMFCRLLRLWHVDDSSNK